MRAPMTIPALPLATQAHARLGWQVVSAYTADPRCIPLRIYPPPPDSVMPHVFFAIESSLP